MQPTASMRSIKPPERSDGGTARQTGNAYIRDHGLYRLSSRRTMSNERRGNSRRGPRRACRGADRAGEARGTEAAAAHGTRIGCAVRTSTFANRTNTAQPSRRPAPPTPARARRRAPAELAKADSSARAASDGPARLPRPLITIGSTEGRPTGARNTNRVGDSGGANRGWVGGGLRRRGQSFRTERNRAREQGARDRG